MRLMKAHVKNYRSVDDSGIFTLEQNKTIFVGANEAGKTAVLQAIQHLSRPKEVPPLVPLKDLPRSKYHLIRTGEIEPQRELVVRGWFQLDDADKAEMPQGFEEVIYVRSRFVDDHEEYDFEGGPERRTKADISKDVTRLIAHLRRELSEEISKQSAATAASAIESFYNELDDRYFLTKEEAASFTNLLTSALPYIDESAGEEEKRFDRLKQACEISRLYDVALSTASDRLPNFILFNNYFRVRPRIQLDHLANRVENDLLDDDSYDYGNLCLLKLLGFTPRELSDAVAEPSPPVNNGAALAKYQAKRDDRQYQLNAASLRGNPPAFSGRPKWSYAVIANFIAGVMPPSAMLGRS